MVRVAWLIPMALVACAAPSGSATPMEPSTAAAESESLDPARITSTPATASAPALERLLPLELGGVELHAFAVGQDIIARLAERLGTDIGRFEVRYASEHGARFFQINAVQLPGADGSALVEAWTDVAYPPEIVDVTVNQVELGTTR